MWLIMKHKNIFITFFTYLFLLLYLELYSNKFTSNLKHTLAYIIGQILIIIILSLINKVKIKKINKIDIKNTLNIFITFTSLIIISTLIINKIEPLPLNQLETEQNIKQNLILSIINICLLSPIIEEITFRYSFKSITNKYLYIIITSIFFGICHLTSINELLYLIPYSLMGIMFSYTFIKTDNILLSILNHSLYNIINFIFLFL